jgi:hypothetical protein
MYLAMVSCMVGGIARRSQDMKWSVPGEKQGECVASSTPTTSARLLTAAGGLDNGGPLGLGDAGGWSPADAETGRPSAKEPRCAATKAGTLARPHVDKSDAGTSQMIASGLTALALNSTESLCNALRESCKYRRCWGWCRGSRQQHHPHTCLP